MPECSAQGLEVDESALTLVADSEQEVRLPAELPQQLHSVLLTGAFASPHPDAPDANTHLTDVAVVRGAIDTGLGEQVRVPHEAELSFDPTRSFHATVVEGRLCLKGAPEALIPHCTSIRRNGEIQPLDEVGLLLGGNLGELGLVVGASLLGLSFPLTSS